MFESMKFNTNVKGLMWDKYPRLKIFEKNYKEFEKEKLNNHLKLVILFVDRGSPYYDEKNFKLRLDLSLEEVGMDKSDVDDKLFNLLLYSYFRWNYDRDFEAWFSLKVAMHELYQFLRAKPSGSNMAAHSSKVAEVSAKTQTLESQLIVKENQIFPDEYTVKVIAREAENHIVTGFAEQNALPSPFKLK